MLDGKKGVGILGLGSCLPPRIRKNDFWPPSFSAPDNEKRSRDFLAIERSTRGLENEVPAEITAAMARFKDDPFCGARLRHVIDDEADSSDMEAEAARRAMGDADVLPATIDLVMVYSFTPDRMMPSNAPALQAKLGLIHAAAWSLDASTASFVAQLVAAFALIRSGVYRRILLVTSQAASRVVDYSSLGSSALGDGAAAVVVGETPSGYGLLAQWIRTDGSLREGVVLAPVRGGEPQHRWWENNRGAICLTSFDLSAGKQAGLLSTRFCREACLNALDSIGLTIDDVALYVGFQTLGWVVDACRRSLGIAEDKVIDTFGDVGYLGAAMIPYNLERAHRAGKLRDGDIVLMYSPGAGYTRAAAVYRWFAPARTTPDQAGFEKSI